MIIKKKFVTPLPTAGALLQPDRGRCAQGEQRLRCRQRGPPHALPTAARNCCSRARARSRLCVRPSPTLRLQERLSTDQFQLEVVAFRDGKGQVALK